MCVRVWVGVYISPDHAQPTCPSPSLPPASLSCFQQKNEAPCSFSVRLIRFIFITVRRSSISSPPPPPPAGKKALEMEATACGWVVRFTPHICLNKSGGKETASVTLNHKGRKANGSIRHVSMSYLQCRRVPIGHKMRPSMELSRSRKDFHATTIGSSYFHASIDERWLLKTKGDEVSSCLDGRSIFLVGMMGSGKTTVGKILSEALGYSFVDSDKYVEQVMGGASVDRIFSQCGESFFRDYESEALRRLSLMPQQVVATGGGAVIRPINWEYMKQGVTVYLDVPLDALAKRIAAVGTESRPLLRFESGDAYTKVFVGLFTLSKKRGPSYASADVTVSVLEILLG
ncbi:shikimate kinase 1, chloroplastic-like isoform X2 [Punica granatum]|uniref:shikimate kinase n=1 Tax=Punica granatum TaxID=22663 RepID=A0A6P8D0I8_PUNGR|nr:shikimate kinase 1, chloroplastic-like isoform X2 [Punica granatum]